MSLLDDIRKDREAGTQGPWEPSGGNGRVLSHWEGIGFWEIANAAETSFRGDSGFNYSTGGNSETNARRIARVPQMEAALLAADELAKVCAALVDHERPETEAMKALTAYHTAIGDV